MATSERVCQILGINPLSEVTCVGITKKHERCGILAAKASRQRAYTLLGELLSVDDDSEDFEDTIREAAGLLLCKRWHQSQWSTIVDGWMRKWRRHQRRSERAIGHEPSTARTHSHSARMQDMTTTTIIEEGWNQVAQFEILLENMKRQLRAQEHARASMSPPPSARSARSIASLPVASTPAFTFTDSTRRDNNSFVTQLATPPRTNPPASNPSASSLFSSSITPIAPRSGTTANTSARTTTGLPTSYVGQASEIIQRARNTAFGPPAPVATQASPALATQATIQAARPRAAAPTTLVIEPSQESSRPSTPQPATQSARAATPTSTAPATQTSQALIPRRPTTPVATSTSPPSTTTTTQAEVQVPRQSHLECSICGDDYVTETSYWACPSITCNNRCHDSCFSAWDAQSVDNNRATTCPYCRVVVRPLGGGWIGRVA